MRLWPWEWGKPRWDVVFRGNRSPERVTYYAVDEVEVCKRIERFLWNRDGRILRGVGLNLEVYEVLVRGPQGDISEFEVDHMKFCTLRRKRR